MVLGGGGFKGMAHIGVFLALEEAGIPIDGIVGTSAGSLMGGAYAHIGSAQTLVEHVNAFVHSDAFQSKGFVGFGGSATGSGLSTFMGRIVNGLKRQVALERMFRRSSAFGGAALRFVVHSLLPDVNIEDLGLPLAVAALDVERGEEVVMTTGSLHTAVTASSSVPGFFPPVEREGLLLVDAGLVNNLPTRAARSMGATRIVAVDLSAGMLDEPSNSSVGMDVLLRTQDIATWYTNRRLGDLADVVLAPELDGRGWLDASDPSTAIAAGKACTEASLPLIRELLRTSTWSG